MTGLSRRELRIGDRERRATADLLCLACGAGMLTLTELDERSVATWHAVTRGDLDRIAADLPSEAWLRAGEPQPPSVARPALCAATIVWFSVSVFMFVVWGLLCLTRLSLLYPWWIWFAVPPGAVLAVVWRVTRGQRVATIPDRFSG